MLEKPFWKLAHAAAQEDDALGLDLPQDLFGGVDLVGVLVQIGDDAVVAIQGRGPLQLDEEVREEEVAGALDHEHQTAGLLDLQLPRVGVGDEPGFPHDLQNVFFRLRPYIGPVVDDTGDGADGTAADAGDVLDRHRLHPSLSGKTIGNVVGNVSSGYSMAQFVQKINHVGAIS